MAPLKNDDILRMEENNTISNSGREFGGWEFPRLRQQVETHLVFGFFSKYLGLGWLIIIAGALILLSGFLNIKAGGFKLVDSLQTGIILLFCGIYSVKKMTRYHQAMGGWISVKIAMSIAAFLCMTVGSVVSLANKQSDALANFFLGLIWLPGIEFIPRIAPFQKWVTVSRLLLSIPVIYMGIQNGWKWGPG
jgi:hypothetical protein